MSLVFVPVIYNTCWCISSFSPCKLILFLIKMTGNPWLCGWPGCYSLYLCEKIETILEKLVQILSSALSVFFICESKDRWVAADNWQLLFIQAHLLSTVCKGMLCDGNIQCRLSGQSSIDVFFPPECKCSLIDMMCSVLVVVFLHLMCRCIKSVTIT